MCWRVWGVVGASAAVGVPLFLSWTKGLGLRQRDEEEQGGFEMEGKYWDGEREC